MRTRGILPDPNYYPEGKLSRASSERNNFAQGAPGETQNAILAIKRKRFRLINAIYVPMVASAEPSGITPRF